MTIEASFLSAPFMQTAIHELLLAAFLMGLTKSFVE
jgi:hypothetical protein